MATEKCECGCDYPDHFGAAASTEAELLRHAALIANGVTDDSRRSMDDYRIIKALVNLARELAKGYYPITQSNDPQFMRMQARAAMARAEALR